MGELVFPSLAAAAFLFLPGFLLLRGLRASWKASLACAPFLALLAYGALGVVYGEAGLACSWDNVFLPVLLSSAGVFALGSAIFWARARRAPAALRPKSLLDPSPGARPAADAALAALYAVVGLAVLCLVFLAPLGDPTHFIQIIDNVHHLGAVRTFVESGYWSSLHSSLYGPGEASINPTPSSSFYPSAWHCVAAMVAEASGCGPAVAVNAVNAVLASVAYPLGMFLLVRTLFPQDAAVAALGAFAASAFGVFPWRLMSFGPIYPNLAAFAIVPAAASCLVMALGDGRRAPERLLGALAFLAALGAMALTQPNAVFTSAVLLAPYCAHRVWRACLRLRAPRAARAALGAAATLAFLVAAALLWLALYSAPFMQQVVTYDWSATRLPAEEALSRVATFKFGALPAQPLLAALAAVGLVRCAASRERRWLAASALVMCAILVASLSASWTVKHVLAGFWYTDSYRLGASVAMMATPLVAWGLATAGDIAGFVAGRLLGAEGARRAGRALACALACAAFAAAAYLPCLEWDLRGGKAWRTDALSADSRYIRNDCGDPSESFYSARERAFVRRALDAVPEGSLVVNMPFDGSAYAYSADGLRTYYRYISGYDGQGETAQSVVIRTRLADVAADEAVRQALRDVGADYLILLDRDVNPELAMSAYAHDPQGWVGVTSVADDTPGFEVVLAEGSMRLYRITG